MHCLKNISRQFVFAGQFLELGKFAFQAADLGPTLHNEVHQRADHEITLSPKAFPFALVGYPLVAQDLEDLADLLKNLPSEAPALLAFPQAFVQIHAVFTRTYSVQSQSPLSHWICKNQSDRRSAIPWTEGNQNHNGCDTHFRDVLIDCVSSKKSASSDSL